MTDIKFEINFDAPYTDKDTSWQKCVGSGHASLAHRTDWCEYAKRVHDELGIEYVRFHGILDDDMLTEQRLSDFMPLPNAGKVRERSFRQVGKVYDNVLAAGMKPFVELSFTPFALASGKRTGLHYRNNITPPKDYEAWAAYIQEFAAYLLNRYGEEEVESWYFEIWNEPDLGTFFSGTQQEYFKLYSYTVRALKAVDGKLRVGGPSTSAGRWLREFLEYTERENLPCDFISTHQYPGDGFGNSFRFSDVFTKYPKIISKAAAKKEDVSQTITKIFFDPDQVKLAPKGILTEAVERSRKIVGENMPLFYTEWNCMAIFGSPAHDEKYSAAFALKTVLDLNGRADCFSFWCCSDLFEEILFLNKPFHGGFGLINNLGIPKPVFWALKLLADCCPRRLQLPDRSNEAVEIAAFTDGSRLQVFVYAQEMDYLADRRFTAELTVNHAFQKANMLRIDNAHCNPKRIWEEMGSPMDPTPAQVRRITEQSKPVWEPVEVTQENGAFAVTLQLSSNDVILIALE